jgi:hypothetical protein
MVNQNYNLKEVKSFANQAAFPTTGTADVIYIDKANNRPYYWTGTAYAPLSSAGTAETITTMVKNADGSFTYTSEDGTQTILNQQFDIIANAQPTPTATGNTTNLNSIFKDTNGVTWAVDFNGEAIQLGSADIRYSKALFVDPINGSDTSGTGSDNNMFKTIAKALTVADGSGFRIVLAPGVYAESPTISLPNLDIVTLAGTDRGNTSIQGNVTFSHTSSSSGIQGIAMTNLRHTGAGALYVTDCQVNNSLDKTGTGYIEITDTQLQGTSGSNLSAGTGLIKDSLIKNMTISGASSGYTLKSNIIDADGTVTFAGGAFYNIQDNSGNIVTTAGVNMEAGLIASGLSSALAKQYVTDFSNKLGMINPDNNATPTKFVTWNETTKRLEISEAPASGASALWTSATTDPTATGNTGTLPRFVENTVNGSKWYIDSTGVAKLIEGAADGCGTVFFDTLDPATATIFDDENPPITDDASLKNLDCAIYISAVDGSVWSSNGTVYKTKTYSYPLHQRHVITATANQTSFTMPKTPIGDTEKVHVSRNGVDISRAFTWVGAVGTYNPANNYGCVIDSADVLQFHFEAL